MIVTTSHIAGQCEQAVQERMALHCPYLFIDEAHHAEAPTWSAFKERFREQRILQFTATPFREDGRPSRWRHYFQISPQAGAGSRLLRPDQRLSRVVEFNTKRVDRAIAEKAIEQLRVTMTKATSSWPASRM